MKQLAVISVTWAVLWLASASQAAQPRLTFSASAENDLYLTLKHALPDLARFDTPAEAIEHAAAGTGVLPGR